MLEDNLKQNCKEVHGKAKLVKGQKTLTFSTTPGQTSPPPPPIRPLLNNQSISKSENLAKSSIVIAFLPKRSSADENGRKVDMILSEI